MAYWFGFAAVAGAFGGLIVFLESGVFYCSLNNKLGLIAFGVQHAHTAISNWRLLFIIEVRFHYFYELFSSYGIKFFGNSGYSCGPPWPHLALFPSRQARNDQILQ